MISTTDKKVYLNSIMNSVQQQSDSHFTCDLGTTISCKRLVLSSFTTDCLFRNFNGKWSDFSIQIQESGDIIKINANEYLDKESWYEFMNDKLNDIGIELIDRSDQLPSYDHRQKFQASEMIKLLGLGFTKLGFKTGDTFTTIFQSTSVPDYSMTSVINIRLDSLSNNTVMSSFGNFAFQVTNNAEFGGKIVWSSNYHPSTQQVLLPQQTSITRLTFTLLDCNLQELQTVGTGNNETETVLLISLFDQ